MDILCACKVGYTNSFSHNARNIKYYNTFIILWDYVSNYD